MFQPTDRRIFKVEAKGSAVAEALLKVIPEGIRAEQVVFACVGTDRSTGDSLGPMVGSALERLGYRVVGTMENTMNAMNLRERIENELPGGAYVIAIDACLGLLTSVGLVGVGEGPGKPGGGVGKVLPPVGDCHIYGIVNVGGFMEYFVLQNTRLSLVISMAKGIVRGITQAIPLADSQVAAATEYLL
jgi:putative sporulation protein YyaC